MTTLNSKKRGRPVGSKNKRGRPAKTFKQSDAHKVLLTSLIGELVEKVKSLEHQAVQYQAVISYLEKKMENK
jgi:hypothetical protein